MAMAGEYPDQVIACFGGGSNFGGKAGKVVLTMKVGEGGRTFGSVSSKEIAEAVKEQMHLDIDKKKIQLKEQIKTLGTHIVSVKLHPEVTAELNVSVKEA